MDAISVTAIIVGVFTLFFIIKKMVAKSSRKQNKNWVVLEHEDGEDGKMVKCYRAQHKENKTESPCFNQINELNEWLNHNAEQRT